MSRDLGRLVPDEQDVFDDGLGRALLGACGHVVVESFVDSRARTYQDPYCAGQCCLGTPYSKLRTWSPYTVSTVPGLLQRPYHRKQESRMWDLIVPGSSIREVSTRHNVGAYARSVPDIA
eukprot:3157756-Rhodomonas_salina.1